MAREKVKIVKVPEEYIKKNMEILGISREEAIKMFLEDEGFETNEEVEKLTEKAKNNKISHDAKSSQPRKKTTRERKPDVEKESIIQILAKALTDAGYSPEITNKAKIIEFSNENSNFKLDLVKKRK